ncbi:CHAT domain-containing protein [Gelidibacter sp. F63206]|uniref:CHAT domain-containing protein n=1 Tax=Gelidibacter sp. F63206 TaxID=2926425 RepID=UPI001FF23222|nr:CHAT domain-containing tetratricopeptide repeat protein [Gelidibacter sp. F63206]MCK0114589.1 CHAT domain-containing protein [Gelidibacter sp. F63206]
MRCYIFIFLSALWLSLGYSQTIYKKDSLTILADSLTKEGSYKKAIVVRKQALKQNHNSSKDYRAYLNAKYHHAKSCDYEFDSYNYYQPDKIITQKVQQQYLDSALQSAINARDLLQQMERPDRIFQYEVQSRVFHQTAYLGNWKHALEQAKLSYEFLKDTLTNSDKNFVDLVYDIGYIYGQLGDYSKSVENYQISLDLYRNSIGEENHDVALAYNNISVQYRKLGLKTKELESLLKAQSIWENLNDESVEKFLYVCYGNLFFWYSYYGDFEKAEAYILKKNELRTRAKNGGTNSFFRNKEEIYKSKLSEWYDLMLHYSRKKDTTKTLLYVDNILKTINSDKKLFDFETLTLSSTLKFYASFLEREKPEEALRVLDRAIDIQHQYQDVYYTKPHEYLLYKMRLLLNAKKYSEANFLLAELNSLNEINEIKYKFELAILNAETAQALNDNEKAKTYFDDAYTLLKDSDDEVEYVGTSESGTLVSFEIIEGFLTMGDFYLQLYERDSIKEYLTRASHRYFFAAKIFNQLYLGQRYNERLFTIYDDINERLMRVGLMQDSSPILISKILNTIENNGSKLTLSKFVFNKQRQDVVVSDQFINIEESIKAELNFYQNAVLKIDGNSEEKLTLWKRKIYELKNDLVKVQDSIKHENKTYYDLNVKYFEVGPLQNSLKNDELILKYIITDQHLFAFLISKNSIDLLPPIDKSKALSTLKNCLAILKGRIPDYEASFSTMRKLLFDTIDFKPYKKIIIIPDGVLNYFPFESLLMDEKMPSVSYSSSLPLYQEQKNTNSNFQPIRIGAFSASNNQSKLPRASDEVNAILKIFEGKSNINASKKEFLQNVGDFNILHLAMHSHIDEMHPEFSALNFYGENDNQLFISELYNESLDADLAVLSACDTGSGFYENGEGVISLSRAFSYAGVPSTVVSLWKVDDEATAKIMTYFYEHLKLGETKDEALKNAKLDYLKYTDDDLLKHPYYWSGFVLSGNTDALVEKQNYWIYLSVLPILALGFFRKKLFQFFKK